MKMGILYWFLRHPVSHPPSELDLILAEQQPDLPPAHSGMLDKLRWVLICLVLAGLMGILIGR
jgi:hypothetical protein